jgi:DNA polymerase-3 subunit delta'
MEFPKYFDSKNSLNLYGLEKDFNFLSKLYSTKNLPKVLMLSGLKGSGKSTLINHFLFSIFDKKNYSKDELKILESSILLKQFKNDIFQNIIYLKGSDFKSITVEDIRSLKSKILQTSIDNKERFIILDDVELFNINSLNALLKIIEEPSKKNFFILINNKTKPLIDTIKSRCLELKIFLDEMKRIEIITKLTNLYKLDMALDANKSKLTPGNFLKFNYIFLENKISLKGEFLDNLSLLLNLYKKNKNIVFINLIFYLADFFFKDLKDKDIIKVDKLYEDKAYVLDNLNKFFSFNLSQNSLINAINTRLNND